jgi:hypothetical protein
MKKKPLPTHADEVDALRLQVAAMKIDGAKKALLDAEIAFGQLLAAAEKKYKFEHAKGEGIDFATRQVTRVKADG